MKGRYEIKDSAHPAARGLRFTSFTAARSELQHAVPKDRFYIYDRREKTAITKGDRNANSY